MFIAHMMGTTVRQAAYFSPPEMLTPAPPTLLLLLKGGGGGFGEEHLPQLLVNSVHSIVSVDPDQKPGCLSSQAMLGLRSESPASGPVGHSIFCKLQLSHYKPSYMTSQIS